MLKFSAMFSSFKMTQIPICLVVVIHSENSKERTYQSFSSLNILKPRQVNSIRPLSLFWNLLRDQKRNYLKLAVKGVDHFWTIRFWLLGMEWLLQVFAMHIKYFALLSLQKIKNRKLHIWKWLVKLLDLWNPICSTNLLGVSFVAIERQHQTYRLFYLIMYLQFKDCCPCMNAHLIILGWK